MSHLVLGVIVTLIRKDVIEFVMIPSTLSKEIRMGILFESYIMHKCECFLRLSVYFGHLLFAHDKSHMSNNHLVQHSSLSLPKEFIF
jgi:hypothetical protein